MANLYDYLNNPNAPVDPIQEKLAQNLNTYATNKDVLATLGQRDRSNPILGLLSTISKPLAVPGNLVRAGIAEATGVANQIPTLANQSGLEELRNILAGNTYVGAGDLPFLRVRPGEGNISRATKLGAALAGDIVTDPLSYIGAPASIARKSAIKVLINSTISKESKLLDNLVAFSPRGQTLVDELAAASPQMRAAELQRAAGVTPEKDTPLHLLNTGRITKEQLAKETLANYLAEGLHAGGRKELMSRLTILSGGDTNLAEQLYRTLPEDVRGGIVLTGPLGKPLKDSEGKYIRLTEGKGDYLGAETLNKIRLGLGEVGLAPTVKKYFAGKGGEIYAEATRGIAAETSPLAAKMLNQVQNASREPINQFATRTDRARLIDYVQGKEAATYRTAKFQELQGRARANLSEAINQSAKFTDTQDAKVFDEAFKDAFFSPWKELDLTNPVIKAAYDAGIKLRANMNDLFEEARSMGIDIGQFGTPESYSPLMYSEAYRKELMKTEAGRIHIQKWDTSIGRDEHIRLFQDPKVAAEHGYAIDPTNPNVVALDARAINRAEGMERFETDPTKVFASYATLMANRIATKKFINRLIETGVGFIDVPHIDTLVTRQASALLQQVAAGTNADLLRVAKKNVKKANKDVYDLIAPTNFKAYKERLRAERQKVIDRYNEAKLMETQAIKAEAIAEQKVSDTWRNAKQVTQNFNIYREAVNANEQIVRDKESIARRLRAKYGRLNSKTNYELIEGIKSYFAENPPKTKKDLDLLNRTIPFLEEGNDAYFNEIRNLLPEKAKAEQELAYARDMLKNVENSNVKNEQFYVTDYANAVVERNKATDARIAAQNIRREASNSYRTATVEFKTEGLNTVRTIMRNYRDAMNAVSKFKYETADEVKRMVREGATDEEVNAFKQTAADRLKVMQEDLRLQRKVMKSSIDYASTRYGSITKQYARDLVKATEKLSKEQYKVFEVINSEKKIQDYIDTIAKGGRSEKEVLDAMYDLKRTFDSIVGLMDEKAYKKLSDSERKFLESYNDFVLKADLKTKTVASPLGKGLADLGQEVVALTPSTSNLYANSSVKKWLADLYAVQKDPTSWEKFLNDVLDPLTALWKQTITVGRGPGFVATNLIGGLFMNHQGGVSIKQMFQSFDVLMKMRKIMKQVNDANPNRVLAVNNQEAMEKLFKELSTIKIGNTDMGTAFREFISRGAMDDTETNFAMRQMAKGGTETPQKVYGTNVKFKENYHTDPSGPVEVQYRRFIDFMTTNKAQLFLNDMNQSAELFMRFGAFINGVETYGDFRTAMDKVYLLHFNYQDLSKAEDWVRRIVPFYTWTRNNVPAQLRSLAMQPGKIQRAMYANEEFQRTFGAEGNDSWVNQVLPEYMANADGFYSKFKFADGSILGFFNKMPYEDLNKIFQVSDSGKPGIRTQSLFQMLGPVGIPLQMGSGVDYSTGQPLQQDTQVSKAYNLLKFIPGTNVQNTPEGTTISGPAALGIRNAFPAIGIGERALSSVNALLGGNMPLKDVFLSKNQQKTGVSSLLNTLGIVNLIGMGASTSTAKSQSGVLYGKNLTQSKQISKITNDLGIDSAWIREQLKAGYTPQEIAIRISRGEGLLIPQERNLNSSKIKQYNNTIARLSSPS